MDQMVHYFSPIEIMMIKGYWKRFHPEIKPYLDTHTYRDPQAIQNFYEVAQLFREKHSSCLVIQRYTSYNLIYNHSLSYISYIYN